MAPEGFARTRNNRENAETFFAGVSDQSIDTESDDAKCYS